MFSVSHDCCCVLVLGATDGSGGKDVRAEYEARVNALERVLTETRQAQSSSAELHSREMDALKRENTELQQRVSQMHST